LLKSLREEYVSKAKKVYASQSIDALKRRRSVDPNKSEENAKVNFEVPKDNKYRL
jgi:hypothetical protein